MAQFFYDYYLYTGDQGFLKQRALPFMKEAALFYQDFLIPGTDGKWIFGASVGVILVAGSVSIISRPERRRYRH